VAWEGHIVGMEGGAGRGVLNASKFLPPTPPCSYLAKPGPVILYECVCRFKLKLSFFLSKTFGEEGMDGELAERNGILSSVVLCNSKIM